MMRRHLFSLATGLFDGRTISAPDESVLALNPPPPGFSYKAGVTDWESQRVDLSTGAIVDYKPPAPDADHEWRDSLRRWVLSQSAEDRRRREAERRAELVALDGRLIRPLAERDGEDADEALGIIEDINKQKAALRAELRTLQAGAKVK
jgi:hypothetical protein